MIPRALLPIVGKGSRGEGAILFFLAAAAWLSSGAVARAQVDPVPGDPAPRYDSQGKRDPFISLRVEKTQPADLFEVPPLSRRPPGLPGLLIDEVTVVGIVSGGDHRIALLRAVDGFTYFARAREALFDGYVERIDQDLVAFVRSIKDTKGAIHRSRVTKRLYSQEVQVEEERGEDDAKP